MLFPFIFQVFTSKSPLPIKQPVVSQATSLQALGCRTGQSAPKPTVGHLPQVQVHPGHSP